MAFRAQEVFPQETYGGTSWSSVVAAAVGSFFAVCLFVCLFLGLIGALPDVSSCQI